MWFVQVEEKINQFSTEDEAVDFFANTIGRETHGKEHWCDLFDEHVWEESND